MLNAEVILAQGALVTLDQAAAYIRVLEVAGTADRAVDFIPDRAVGFIPDPVEACIRDPAAAFILVRVAGSIQALAVASIPVHRR